MHSKIAQTGRIHAFISELQRNKGIYLLAVPGLVYFVLFQYLPMLGIVIAFKDYQISKGILGSAWVGFDNFKFFFTSGHALRVSTNTLLLNTMFISSATFLQVTFAILLNEVRSSHFKKITQSIMFLPFFMSWIVVSVMVLGFLENDTGVVNRMLESLGMNQIQWYASPKLWPGLLTLFYNWKWVGYGVVIYLATISGIDTTYYEAAAIDGANRIQQVFHITLPFLSSTIMILVLLSIGKIFYGDFGMIYGLVGDNGMLFPTTDVIDTYVYRALRHTSNFGMSTAVGLYQSIMGFIIVYVSNRISRKYKEDGALF